MIFKIKEVYIATGWTTIRADSIEEAHRRLENDEGEFDIDMADLKYEDTDWKTLQEVPQKKPSTDLHDVRVSAGKGK